jgi:hypothetical protein
MAYSGAPLVDDHNLETMGKHSGRHKFRFRYRFIEGSRAFGSCSGTTFKVCEHGRPQRSVIVFGGACSPSVALARVVARKDRHAAPLPRRLILSRLPIRAHQPEGTIQMRTFG